MDTATAGFSTTVRQITEMPQQKKTGHDTDERTAWLAVKQQRKN